MIKKILIFILSILVIGSLAIFFSIHKGQIQHNPQDVIYRGKALQLIVSACPLQTDSLSVESITSGKNIVEWTKEQHAESYNLLENAATLWRELEFIDDFMVIGRIPPRMHADRFFWEIIPFPKAGLNFIDQFCVIWRLAFNSPCLSAEERQTIKQKYREFIPFFSHTYQVIPEQTTCPKSDVFCDPDVIAKQLLYEGKLIDVLYNYAPIGVGEEKLHFLLIPKAHRTGFPELTLDEYLEAQEIASKLILYYAQKGFPIVYLYHKTGKYAGQTVPHWHEHLIFAQDETDAFLGKLDIVRRRLIPSGHLSDRELEPLVNKYRQQVQEAMNRPPA